MLILAFLCGIAILFTLVLAWEAGPEERAAFPLRPTGLLRWLVSGNWPAKVGGALLVIGSGALLRYLMLNVAFPPNGKLLSGIAIAALLGTASAALKDQPLRRAIHLALGGAALGVAYLTAYSAYGFFHFINDLQALGLLFVVACGATAFALQSGALSIALFAMVGAYIAPAFALEDVGPQPVYGYYLLASCLTLLMVWQRGWRALIHLSFLFTLAGGLFFGWTQQFYSAVYYTQMQPLLLALVAIHLAMPLLESSQQAQGDGTWQRNFDMGFFLTLPLVAGVLTLGIAPAVNREGVLGLLALATLWIIAAGAQHLRFKAGAPRFVAVALLFVLLAVLLAIGDVPYLLIATVIGCAVLAAGPFLPMSGAMTGLLVTGTLTGTACLMLQLLFESVTGTPLLNAVFARHIVLAIALLAAGAGQRGGKSGTASLFMTLGTAWLVLGCARELARLNLDFLAQAAYLLALAFTAGYAVLLRNQKPTLLATLGLAIALCYTGFMSAVRFAELAFVPMLLGQAVFSLLAWAQARHGVEGASLARTTRGLLPVLILPWALAINDRLVYPHLQVVMTFLVGSALLAAVQTRFSKAGGTDWSSQLSPLGYLFFGSFLFYLTLLHIQRDVWAVAYELLALTYLLVSSNAMSRLFGMATACAAASVAAAMVLRLVGPPGTLTILALNDIVLPAIISLFWASIGAAMTWWSTRNRSRSLWSTGAVLMVAAAIKLVLFDFGSLGQLGNILAMMATGGVFLLVAWLAPFPPKDAGSGKEVGGVAP